MKKSLIVFLLIIGIGTVVLAKNYEKFGNCHSMMNTSEDLTGVRRQIKEFEMANQNEMKKEKPNFKIIEENNLKIGKIKAELKTKMMQEKYTQGKTIN